MPFMTPDILLEEKADFLRRSYLPLLQAIDPVQPPLSASSAPREPWST